MHHNLPDEIHCPELKYRVRMFSVRCIVQPIVQIFGQVIALMSAFLYGAGEISTTFFIVGWVVGMIINWFGYEFN